MSRQALALLVLPLAACAAKQDPEPIAAVPEPVEVPVVVRTETVTVVARDPALERELAGAQLRLLAREAEIEDLQAKLDEARREVVRSLAKLQTVASRAEAASAMAEAELALQSLRRTRGSSPEANQARGLLQMSTTEFNNGNYGGALYLANQVKAVAAASGRLVTADAQRPGETVFAVPLKLVATGRSNVRDGPGTDFKVLFTIERGAALSGLSYEQGWIRVSDEGGRVGWIYQPLVQRR